MTAICENTKSGFEWLGEELKAKAIRYEVAVKGTGEEGPTWDEKLGVFAKMDDDLQKDLAYLIAYGDYADNTLQFKNVVNHLSYSIYAVACEEKQRNKSKIAEIAFKIARMELYFYLHPWLETKFKEPGRNWFCGLDDLMSYDNYRAHWSHFGKAAKMMLVESAEEAELHIKIYRSELKKS